MSMDLSKQPEWSWFKGRTVIVTGAANGLGRGMARQWAEHGAFIVVGDMDETAGRIVVEELQRISGGKQKHHFVKCDVTSWESQVNLFKEAIDRSPGKHIDVVVANAGIGESDAQMFLPEPSLDLKKPNMKTIDIDLTGVIYTAHLAYWAFAQKDTTNGPFSQESPRHHSLLLIGSMASLKYSTEPLYAAAKHGVLGLFRALRRPHYFTHTDRNNPKSASIKIKPGLLCPFFTETNIIKKDGVIALPADVELTKIEEVVEAAGRIVLDKEGGKAIMVLNESMAKVMGRGRNRGGLVVVEALEGKL